MINLLQIVNAYDTQTRFYCSCDLDLDPMTLIYDLELNILKTYLHAKMNF